jgi:hypothetical protein
MEGQPKVMAPGATKPERDRLYFICPRCGLAKAQERGRNGPPICPHCQKRGFNVTMHTRWLPRDAAGLPE